MFCVYWEYTSVVSELPYDKNTPQYACHLAVLHHVYVTILFSRITDSTLSPDDYNLEFLPVKDTKRWQEMANVSTLRIGEWSAIHL